MGFNLRNVEIEDKFKIAEVAEKCAPPIRSSVVGTYEYLARCFRSYFLVVENDEGEIVGFISGFPNLDVKGEIWIYQVAILEDFRGHGFGSMLFEAFISQAKKDGYKILKSHYVWDNEISAGLHSKYGFEKFGKDDRGPFIKVNLE